MFLAGNQMKYLILNSNSKPLYTTLLNTKKLPGYRIGRKFDKEPLGVEQNNYLIKIVNVYIVYDIDASPRNTNNNFKSKNCLFGTTTVVKNSDKDKYVYSRYGITFDSGGSWNFDNDFARNVTIFGVDDTSSFHSDNYKNNFLILGGPALVALNQKKKFSINFSKANTNICLSLHHNANDSYLLMEKRSLNLKQTMNFPAQFCLGSISKVSLNGNVYDFSVDYNSINKSDTLNIHNYLMMKRVIKINVQPVYYLLSFSESLAPTQTKCVFK